ncbi:LacI family DNA-binding transcriptional regulator [Flexibacterium corallicola]|uniref:LacI family DNA-binding transcriptional regulator n=1 Tax=Flexibacterium corallicola TaxID=3037259 RepID=UPI00286F14F8|nr:substrate-binding domain-containing protein [Pseudovibrio sp. M1P-2-3]
MNLKSLSVHLGLSQTTVSRALNGYSDVSVETRKRVEEAAKKYGYRPNASARKLATGRSRAIGVSFPTDRNLLADPHFIEFLIGLTEQAAECDYDLLLSATKSDSIEGYQRTAGNGAVDLMVLSSLDLSEERLDQLKDIGRPFIVHGRIEGREDYAYLDIDNRQAFYLPTKLLLDLGHRRIAILNGPDGRHYSNQRAKGWADALKEYSIEADLNLTRGGVMSEEVGYRLAKDLLKQAERPTALLCSSVVMAVGAYRAAGELGLSVGSDVSITAHDDGLPLVNPQRMEPALTVTHSPIRAAGKEIALMAKRFVGGVPLEQLKTVWDVELIYRPSVGAPRKKVD